MLLMLVLAAMLFYAVKSDRRGFALPYLILEAIGLVFLIPMCCAIIFGIVAGGIHIPENERVEKQSTFQAQMTYY